MKIRIAWVDKLNSKCYYGDWRDKTKNNLILLKKWIISQNNIYGNTYYWIEYKKKNKIENYPLFHLEDLEYININYYDKV